MKNREEETISQLTGRLAEANRRIADLEQSLKEHKEIEKELLKGEERSREFMENISDECYETDLAGNITYINEIASLHSGYRRDEMIGMNYRQYSPPEVARRIFKIFNEIYRSGKPAVIHDYEQFTRLGQSRYVDMSVSLIRDIQGEPVGFRGISRDVTERKKYLDELERYRDFMENIADGCFENDLEGTITYANEIGAKRLGLTREELIGMNNTQYASPEEVARVNEIFRKIYKTGKPAFIDEYEIIRKDGSRFFIEMSAALIRDAAGNPVGYRGTTRDITEKKRMLDALRESEKNYRLLIENSPTGIMIYSPEGRIILSNRQAQIFLEATEEELAGVVANQSMWKLLRPDGSPLPADEHPVSKAVEENRAVHDFLMGVIGPKSGNVAWFIVNAQPQWDERGGMTRIIGSFLNVTSRINAETALRNSESKYRFLTEQMSDIVWTLNENMRVTYVSPSIKSVLGYSREDLMGRDPGKLFMTEESYAHALDVIKKEIAPCGQDTHRICRSVSFEVACRHLNGSLVWLSVVVSFIRDNAGRAVGFHSVARNVTERKRAEEEKEKLICELQEALSEVKKLSGMLPICAHCKKIRDDQGYWNQMESYITKHSEALFSHCICPECASKVYGEYLPKKNQ